LPELTSRLIKIGFQHQAIVEPTINLFEESSLIVCFYMTNIDRRNINTDPRKYRGDD